MRKSEEDWLALGRGLSARGLGLPLLVISDGAPGLTNTTEALWPRADRQRCTVHKVRNLLAKIPAAHQQHLCARYWAALDEATGQRDGERRLRELVGELSAEGLESAAACLADDLEALCEHLRYPLKHRRRWRSTNLLERSLGEVRRRTNVIGRFPGELSCLSLCWAVLDLVIAHSNDFTFTELEQLKLERSAGPGHGDLVGGRRATARYQELRLERGRRPQRRCTRAARCGTLSPRGSR
jgi:putative transposase